MELFQMKMVAALLEMSCIQFPRILWLAAKIDCSSISARLPLPKFCNKTHSILAGRRSLKLHELIFITNHPSITFK